MARGKVRAKVVLTVASVAFSLVAYNAFAIGDHYGKSNSPTLSNGLAKDPTSDDTASTVRCSPGR